MVHQINQSLQSIKYHRTKWPWFPFKIKVIPLRLMGRYRVIIVPECSWFSFICIKHICLSSYIHSYVHALLKEKENQCISIIISCPIVIGCLLFVMPAIYMASHWTWCSIFKTYVTSLSTQYLYILSTIILELIWCSTLMTYLICQAPLSLKT